MSKCFLLALIISILPLNRVYCSWQKDLGLLLASNNQEEINILITKVLKEKPNWRDVISFIKNSTWQKPDKTGIVIEKKIMCSDGITRPYITFIPSSYDPATPTPLVVYLHGGVSRTEIRDDRIEYAERNEYMRLAKKNGWMMVFPFGQKGATWWDSVGMKNILNIVRKTKRDYNIDDDRVWMTGFSDGASASFLFSMIYPTDFAAFVPLSGHMGVGGLSGKLPLYPANMSMSPLHAINTDIDNLYPAAKMRKMIDMARDAGANIHYREYNGIGHDFGYADEELPRIESFLDRNPRNSLPHHIEWKTGKSEFGKSYWLKINGISIGEPPAPWHIDSNLSLIDDRVSFGFFPDYEYEGSGVKVDGLSDGDTVSRRMGLKPADIIIKCNEMNIVTIDDLDAFKVSVKRGEHINVVVKRSNQDVLLEGKIPDSETYLLFPRETPSAAVIADFMANTFSLETSRYGHGSILIHPDMVQLDQDVVVKLDGNTVFNGRIEPDIKFILKHYLENRDRKLLYVKEIMIQ